MLVWLKLSDSGYGTPEEQQDFQALEDRIDEAINEHGVGEFDGNEVGEGWYRL